jgi:hypothetical protein
MADSPPVLPIPVPAPLPGDLDLQFLIRSVLCALRKPEHLHVLADDDVRKPLLLARTAADRLSRAGRLRGDGRRGYQREENGCSPE